MSNEKKTIYAKLAEIRVELQESNLKKSGNNKYAGFKYFELTDFLPKVNTLFKEKDLLSKYDLTKEKATLTIINSNDEKQLVFEISAEINDTEIKMGDDKQSKAMMPVQRLGSVITYTKRYLFINALEIVENDVLDATIGQPQIPTENDKYNSTITPAKITEDQAKKLLQLAQMINKDLAPVLKHYKISKVGDLNINDYNIVWNKWQQDKKKLANTKITDDDLPFGMSYNE